MIEINFDIDGVKKEITLPSDYEEMTVGQYMALNAIDFKDKTEIEIIVETISLFGDISVDEVYMIPVQQFNEIVEAFKYTNDAIDKKDIDSIKVGDDVYYLKSDFTSLNLGETISIDMIMKSEKNVNKSISKLLCVFLRKKRSDGNLEEFNNSFMSREDDFKDIIITEVYQLMSFFLTLKQK